MYYSMLDWHWREPCVYHSSWNMYLSNGRACKQLCDSSVTMGWGGGFCGSHSRTIPYSCWLSCWLSYIKAVVCSVDNKFTSGCVSVSRITFFPLQFHTAHWKISMLTLFSWFFFSLFFLVFNAQATRPPNWLLEMEKCTHNSKPQRKWSDLLK